MNGEVTELAKKVLAVLDKQREYFKTRDMKVLKESKDMEYNLRKECENIVNPDTQQSLF